MHSSQQLKHVFLLLLTLLGCSGQNTSHYCITPEPEMSLDEHHDLCITLDQFFGENVSKNATLNLIPGHHTLTRRVEVVDVHHFSILGNSSASIHCTSPTSFLFEGIYNLEIRNIAIVSCGSGNSSSAIQVRSVQQLDVTNVTLQESAGESLNVQDSTGRLTGVRFTGSTGAGLNIVTSTILFEGSNTFSDNLNGGITSYCSTLQFSGVNQFARNIAKNGGAISATNSTINCLGNMSFEYNSAELYGGGIFANATKVICEDNITITFVGNTASNGGGLYAREGCMVKFNGKSNFINNLAQGYGGGVFALDHATFEFIGTINFVNNLALAGGGGIAAIDATVDIAGSTNFMSNSAQEGGGILLAWGTTVRISGFSNFISNSAVFGGGVHGRQYTSLYISGASSFIKNSAQIDGGGVDASSYTVVYINGSVNFINNSAQRNGGGVSVWNHTVVHVNGCNNFTYNSAMYGGAVNALYIATVDTTGYSNFTENSAVFGGVVFAGDQATVKITGSSSFVKSSSIEGMGGGLFAWDYATVIISGVSNFVKNSALFGGGLLAMEHATVVIDGFSNFISNSAAMGGGVVVLNRGTVKISGVSNFMNNSAQLDGGGLHALYYATLDFSGTISFIHNSAECYGGGIALLQDVVLSFSGNISFTKNSAKDLGGAMFVDLSSVVHFNGYSMFMENWSQYGGGISMQQSEIMFQGNGTVFSNNTASYGGAIQALESKINITGIGLFIKNFASVSGGALALASSSISLYIFETAFLNFNENVASSFGGAIYIEDKSIHCSYIWRINGFIGIYDSIGTNTFECYDATQDLHPCFLHLASYKDKINISFSGNSAKAGSVLFGGEIEETVSNIKFKDLLYVYYVTVGNLFQLIINVNIDDTNVWPTISSNPNRICRCINDQPDFTNTPSPYEVSVYPGQTLGVSLVAVGQRNGTVPSTITAQYDADDGASFRDLQSTQTSNPTCTELYYTVFSRKETEVFNIYAEGICGAEGVPLSVNVTLLHCPTGFSLSNKSNQCACEERLQKYTERCNISKQEITRTTSDDFWVGVDNINGTEGLILHPHCPFDYCLRDTVHFTMVENKLISTNASVDSTIDAQCRYNRSGLLCGKCQKGLSLVFGSSECQKCSNSYLSLIIAFALAGLVLVIFLLILKLTVAVGTINGLIFYANIIAVNRSHFFASGEKNILTVFIAWVNLDLGIETCFFDGMDAYSKAWLQYAFPIYVWVLVAVIILASRHSFRLAHCLGTNPVAVLATLFLLSYAKLLQTIINPLFFTFLDYPLNSKAVWLVDGNVSYVKGKHIPLFLTSLLALFVIFIPFTLLLLLGQCIQAQSERKCCSWISDYRITTFLDVYHGPFKIKHRYWCGLLLVTRFCLFLLFAFNVIGDPSINILGIAVCLIGLLVIFIWFKVYKAWYLNVLEATFITNLLVLAIGTYYVELSGGSQNVLSYTSVTVAFATFCGIVVYHSYQQLKGSKLPMYFKKFFCYFKTSADDMHSNAIGMNNEEDTPCKCVYAKAPTTTVIEIPF